MTSKKMQKTYYYKSYNEDFVKSKNQDYKILEDYKWINNNVLHRLCSNILYFLAYIFSLIYCKLILHVSVKNRKVLKKYKKQGYFLYGNHTQPVGDVFIPAYVSNKRIYTLVSQSNLGVVGIGPILPMLGALPIPDTIKDTKKLLDAIKKRIEQKKIAYEWAYNKKLNYAFETADIAGWVQCEE